MAKKIINDSCNVVKEMVEGFAAAYPRHFERLDDECSLLYRNRRKDRVSLVVGGGSGHEPLFFGFVGKGLADAAPCGNVFTSPNPQLIYNTAMAVENGNGVLFVYGNYSGDNLNFDMAEEMLQEAGIKTAHVRVWDDCASAPPERLTDRRGIAGNVFAFKVAGAACDAGLPLDQVVRITEKARDNLCSIGVATTPGSIPGASHPPFTLDDNEIEYGMGIHGEPGILRTTLKPADLLTEQLYSELKKDMKLKGGEELCVLVNGLGSTTLLEMGIVYRRLAQLLEADNILTYDAEIQSYCTCQEMGGFSITFLRLDAELKQYYNAPCHSPYYTREGI